MNVTTIHLVEIEEDVIDPWAFAGGTSPLRPGWYVVDEADRMVLGPFVTAHEAGDAARTFLDKDQ
jgi:hypothetical protein